MIFRKGKFSIVINKIGGISIKYRRFAFEIGLFNNDEGIPLFLFKIFNFIKEIKTFQIFYLQILKFQINIDINYGGKI